MPRSLLLVTAGTLGDVLPAVALGRALAARGHRVRLACAPSLAGWLTGLEHVPVRPDLGPEAARRHTWAWDPAAPAARPEPGFGVEQHVHRIRDALPAAREADLLLTGSTVTGGRLLAELAGRPRLTFSATPAHYSPDHPGGRWRLGLLPADDPEAARRRSPSRGRSKSERATGGTASLRRRKTPRVSMRDGRRSTSSSTVRVTRRC